ncbi:hypothetical protein D9M71_236950 [compost metagenome]
MSHGRNNELVAADVLVGKTFGQRGAADVGLEAQAMEADVFRVLGEAARTGDGVLLPGVTACGQSSPAPLR